MEEIILIKTKEETLNYLKSNNVAVLHLEDHDKIDTVQQGLDKFKDLSLENSHTFAKNLFMKSKAGGLYLLTVHPVYIYLIT